MRAHAIASILFALGVFAGTELAKAQSAAHPPLDPPQRVASAPTTSPVEPSTAEIASPQGSTPLPRSGPSWIAPLSELSVTRERPLFAPSRRPPPPALAAVTSKPAPAPRKLERPPLTLVGTIVGEARHVGIFVEQPTQKLIRLKEGEGHAGWILRQVSALDVRLENADQTATLALRPTRPEAANGTADAVVGSEPAPIARHRKRQ